VVGEQKNVDPGGIREIVENMSTEEFAHLCNRLASHMGFKIRKSVYRGDTVVLDAYMHIPGNALHYLIVFLRKEKVSREELMDILFAEETVELRWMIITTGQFEDDAKSLSNENVSLMEWNDFERLLTNFGLKEELMREKRGKEAREGRFLPSVGELDSMLQWAEEFLRGGNYEKALEYVNRALNIKDVPRARKLKARILLALKRGEEAIPLLTSLLEEDVKDDEAWHILGEILEALENFEEAERAYEQCVKHNPRNIGCWINRGNVLTLMEKYEEALLCYENALQIRQDLPEVWNNRGVVLKYMGRYDDALKSYNNALRFNPDFVDAYLNKAYLYYDRRKYENAHNEVMEYLRRKDSSKGWILLARIYLKRKREEDAKKALEKALQIEPGNMEARELLKRFSEEEKISEGIEELRKILEEEMGRIKDRSLKAKMERMVKNEELATSLKILMDYWRRKENELKNEVEILRNTLIEEIQRLAAKKERKVRNLKRMKTENLIKLLKELRK